jgi:aminopeptidase S
MLKAPTRTVVVALAVGMVTLAVPSSSTASPAPLVAPPDVPIENTMAHLRQFQAHADANGGNRAHGRPGYRASVDYVKSQFEAAGLKTTVQPFSYGGATGWNVIADYPSGDPNNIVVVGGHLDSVTAGPGINDNASGSAAILETALTYVRTGFRPRSLLRFALWGAEERGLIGSRYYVDNLPQSERGKIKYYLNYDMVGAKNTSVWRVYQNNPTVAAAYQEYFRIRGASMQLGPPGGGSDHQSFIRIGVPIGGVFSGSDPCYHRACDTINNVAANVVDVSTDSIAHVMAKLGGETSPG